MLGVQRPRLLSLPAGEDHPDADAVVEFAAALGIVLDEWQELVLRMSLRRCGDLWAAFSLGLCVPRQNGKNEILLVRELAGPLLLGEGLVMHTAHLADTAKEAFRRLDLVLEANEWLSRDVRHIRRQNGHEAIEFRNRNRIRFRTRTRGGGRGYTGDVVIFDEAMILPVETVDTAVPLLSAMPDPQVWYTGSAVDRLVHEDGVAFSRLRSRALSEESPGRRLWAEWSIDVKSPDEVTPEMLDDERKLRESNPAYGLRITREYLREEQAILSERGYAVERFGAGDWWRPELEFSLLTAEEWDALREPSSVLTGELCLAYDIAPDRSFAAIAMAGRNELDEPHVEIVEHRRGTGWLAPRLRELVDRYEPVWRGCDSYAMLPELERDGFVPLNTQELGLACLRFVDAVRHGAFRHLGSDELRTAVLNAKTRPLGDSAFAWSRRNSPADITPLYAATLALDQAIVMERGEVMIY